MANVTLRSKKLAKGRLSLYLYFYPEIIHPKTGKPTRREFLKLKIFQTPKTNWSESTIQPKFSWQNKFALNDSWTFE